jgi:integrase
MKEVDAQIITQEEYQKLLRTTHDHRDLLLIRVLYETGCTVKELVNLKVHDFHTSNCSIHISAETTRTKTSRTSSISPTLCHELLPLTLHKQPTSSLFSSRQSDALTTKRVRQIIQSLSKKSIGREISPQTLRYTHIAHAIQKNIPIKSIQAQVGLDTLRMTQLVDRLTPKRVTNAYDTFFAH